MWVSDSAYQQADQVPIFFERLREMGINTAMVHGDASLKPVLDNRFPYYVENMVNRGLCLKWNSKVQDWEKLLKDWNQAGRSETLLVRDYCLDDPEWQSWAKREMQQLVRKNMAHAPVAYDIRDELSTTMSANPFDYDFNPIALRQFRAWLKTAYVDLRALNQQWQIEFKSWDDVKPFTTDLIKNRMGSGDALPRGKPDWQAVQALKFRPPEATNQMTRWNFSPWADFRTYMDVSLARALAQIRESARALDPQTPVGIEGTQMPHAFGGYDLWRLSKVLDWVEPYDIGNAREIFGSFMPGRTLMTTVFEKDTAHARRRLWHLLLEGDRGCIIWWSEDCVSTGANPKLTAKAEALAPVLKEMTSPLAKLFMGAERERDPVWLHYSQPSIQVDWLLESTVDGSTWVRRFSSYEAEHNRLAQLRNSWLKAFQDLGYSPQFISSEQLESGTPQLPAGSVLVLPGSLALSDKESQAIVRVAKDSSNVVFGTGVPGCFDEHGKLRKAPALAALVPSIGGSEPYSESFVVRNSGYEAASAEALQYGAQRLKAQPNLAFADWVKRQLEPAQHPVSLPANARVRVHRFRAASARLIAFERNIDYHMSEDLKQAGGNEALERPEDLEARLRQPVHIYDLRTLKYLGHTDRIRFTLDPWQPSLFALTEKEVSVDSLLK